MELTNTEYSAYANEAFDLVEECFVLGKVSQRNGDIALDRWQHGMTYDAIAAEYGISKERVRQILAQVERKVAFRLRLLRAL